MAREGGFAAAAPSAVFGAADSPVIPEKLLARKRNCFQLQASFRLFRSLSRFAGPEGGKKKATADSCANPTAIVVHNLSKRAGSFIPLHL